MKSKENLHPKSPRAWVIAVSMGYGHQRTAYPLKELSPQGNIINANNYLGIPEKDRRLWGGSRSFYEFISNFQRIPFIGDISFRLFDRFQKIISLYPKKDLSRPSFMVRRIFSLIQRGWGKHLVEILKKKPLPLVTTFFIPAYMAEFFNYPNDIYCIICDADISRTWVVLNPSQSNIKYFAPTPRVKERLELYGVKKENIFLTGYPLPKENLGSTQLEITRYDISHRLLNLDYKGAYRQQYTTLIKKYVGSLPRKSNHPLTIMFSVGGAGAQKEIVIRIIESLAKKIRKRELKFILGAGIKEEVKNYFLEQIDALSLRDYLDKSIEIVWDQNLQNYFKKFNQALRTTDILWTKPSELSFYSALGIPIIMTPPLGSQEDLNRDWLLRVGAGISQEDPRYTDQWLFDLLESGWFAEAAMQGYIEVEKMGTFNIENIIHQHAVAHH